VVVASKYEGVLLGIDLPFQSNRLGRTIKEADVMTATHILFVPWERAENAEEKRAEAKDWMKVGNAEKSKSAANQQRRFKAIIFKPGRISENLLRMQTGQIYILGHGAAGYASIGNIDDAATAVLLSAREVAARLFHSGLNPEFAGSIKCFSCHSAEAGQGTPSFAQEFADRLRSKGYVKCQYFGYNNAVITGFKDFGLYEAGAKHKHWAVQHPTKPGAYVEQGRASTQRVPV
jgi:hypothetical protein